MIVKQDEPPLSHPIVNFSEMGIPCFLMADSTKIEKKQPPFLVCLQEGVLYPWEQTASTDQVVKSGYTTHPAPIQISMMGTSFPPMTAARQAQDIVPQDLKELLTAVRATKTRDAALEILVKHPTLQAARQESAKLQGRVSALSHVPAEVKAVADAVQSSTIKLRRA